MIEPSGSQAPGTEAKNEAAGTTRVTFRFHTRALAALGRDLVTSDVVAVMELVKNAYDALATRVEVRIRSGDEDSNGAIHRDCRRWSRHGLRNDRECLVH